MFDFSIKNTIKRLLHPLYRKGKQIAWLCNMLSYIGQLKLRFVRFRDQTNYELQFNSQTLSMEARLNEHHNVPLGTIYIETVSVEEEAVFIHWLSENQKPIFISWLSETAPIVFIRWLSEYATQSSGYEFIVWIPQGFTLDTNELTAIVNQYRLAGKRFVIQWY